MFYLVGRSQLAIAYILYCYMRFSHNPKSSHKIILKYIAIYLEGIQTKINVWNTSPPTLLRLYNGYQLISVLADILPMNLGLADILWNRVDGITNLNLKLTTTILCEASSLYIYTTPYMHLP